MELPSQVVVLELEFLEPGLEGKTEMRDALFVGYILAGPTLVGNEGPSTFTLVYLGMKLPSFPTSRAI